ncbi:MAG TPA: hypothetical protein VF421_08615 [Niabella sp.]
MQPVRFLYFALLLLSIACAKPHKTSNQTSFEFGTSYNMCAGPECVTTYRIKGAKLYKITSGPGITSSQKITALSASALTIAQKLQNTPLPDYLYQNKNKSFGCPDCADQGATALTIIHNEITTSWNFDNDLNNNPPEIRAYIQKIWETMTALTEN